MALVKCPECFTEFYGRLCPKCGCDIEPLIARVNPNALSPSGWKTDRERAIEFIGEIARKKQSEREKQNPGTQSRSLGTKIGQYEVLAKIDEGAFGAVFKARDTHLDKTVAIKALHLENPSALRDEAKALSELQHENIVGFRHLFTEGGCWYLVMEFVGGGSLRKLIQAGELYEGGPEKALERILCVSLQFAEGLAHAHAHGIVHQDVKPGNVLIAPTGVAKVSDFGLAKARAVARTTPMSDQESLLVSIGGLTPAYCSPEQYSCENLTSRTDVWSWGLSTLEMFTGSVTWHHGTVAPEALRSYLATENGRTSIPRLPADLAKLLERCFCREPGRRPTMDDIAGLLRSKDRTRNQKPLVANVTIARTAEEKAAVYGALENMERFAVVGNGTIIDTKTNLMWAAAGSDDYMDLKSAKNYVRGYSLARCDNWRLPTPEELKDLYEAVGRGLRLFKLTGKYGEREYCELWSSKGHLTLEADMYHIDCLDTRDGRIRGCNRNNKNVALPVRSSN